MILYVSIFRARCLFMKVSVFFVLIAWVIQLGLMANPAWAQTADQASTNIQTQASKVNFSPLFVALSDVMGQVRAGDTAVSDDLRRIKAEFDGLPLTVDTALKDTVIRAFDTAISTPSADSLNALSVALYELERAQNPIDYSDRRRVFAKKIAPAIAHLTQAIHDHTNDQADIQAVKDAYDVFNRTWIVNERVVRNTSMVHYGKIETAMALIRVALESNPPNLALMQDNLNTLQSTIDSYNHAGRLTSSQPSASDQSVDLAYGVSLLRTALDAFKSGDNAHGQASMGEFLQIWASIESEVATRDPTLYIQTESQTPIIMAKGHDPDEQRKLAELITDLSHLSASTANYTAIDAMLILLREGLEALLIVMALITAMNAADQHVGKRWVWAGVVVGLLVSIAVAIALQRLFPTLASGTSREALEGVVGIAGVVMMIGVGAWLHSKASLKSWNAYIKKHMGSALSAGSFLGVFGLAFLSVFREGAETVLFYAGILPKISMGNFLLGIAIALVLLVVIAILLFKSALKLPIPQLFLLLTWLIYALAFKILGVSVHALQLNGILPMTHIALPAMPTFGLYPTYQGIGAQLALIVVISALILMRKRSSTQP